MIEPDHSKMMPGDILEYRCPEFGIVWQWRVHGIYSGHQRQETLIELQPILAEPGSDNERSYTTTMVPEPLTRSLTLIKRVR